MSTDFLSPENDAVPQQAEVKFLQMLGVAIRARCAIAGSDAVLDVVRSRRAKLVVMARDVGANASKKYHDKCSFYNIPLYRLSTRDELGRACGRGQSVVVAVTDPGFAAKLAVYAGELGGGEAFDETESL